MLIPGPFTFTDLRGRRYEWKRQQDERPRLYLLGENAELVREEASLYKNLPGDKKPTSAWFERKTLEVLGCFLNQPRTELSWKDIEAKVWPDGVQTKASPGTQTHVTPDETAVQKYVGYIRRLLLDEPQADGKSRIIEAVGDRSYKFLLTVESASTAGVGSPRELLAALNAKFGYLNDPEFGAQIAQYFLSQSEHHVYCHDLRTTFLFNHVKQGRFPALDQARSPLLDTCFALTIREAVNKTCTDKIRCAAFLDSQRLSHHFTHPEYDFVWNVDLPDDADFKGNVSDIFTVGLIEIDHVTIYSERQRRAGAGQSRINTVIDDNEIFAFDVDVSGIAASGPLRKLSYVFHTLKAKDFRYVSYAGTAR